MVIRVTAKMSRKGDARAKLRAIERAVREKARRVEVGFPAGKASAGIIRIAVWNHEGTSRGIPPRPFITIAMFKGRGELRQAMRAHAKSILQGSMNMTTALRRLGQLGQVMIQQQIEANTPPPNAPSTIAAKGHGQTLIETGRMLAAVTWKIAR